MMMIVFSRPQLTANCIRSSFCVLKTEAYEQLILIQSLHGLLRVLRSLPDPLHACGCLD